MIGYWPGSSIHQRATLANPRFEDFEYSSFEDDVTGEDCLAWMGNGMIMAQTEGTSTTTYLDEIDYPPLAEAVLPKSTPSPSSGSPAMTPFSIVEEEVRELRN